MEKLTIVQKVVNDIAAEWLEFVQKENNFNIIDEKHVVLNTPITDPFGDSISLMIFRNESNYRVTDQGYTIWNLTARNINVKDKKSRRNQLLKSIASFENVKISDKDEIYQIGNRQDLPQIINDVTQAVLKISNLAYSYKDNVKRMFVDDVMDYFAQNRSTSFNYVTGLSMQGKSKLNYRIDYLFTFNNGKSNIAQVSNSLSKGEVEKIIGVYLDTEEFRKENNQNTSYSVIVPEVETQNQNQLAKSLDFHKIDVVPFNDKKAVYKKYNKVA